MISSNDDLLIDDLREGFRRYLDAEYPHIKNKSVTLSDAFYLQRHNIGISLWEALRNEGTMELCREKLEKYFKDVRKMKSPRSNSFTYMSSIKILKEYIDKTFGGVHREPNDISDEYENIIPPIDEEVDLIPKPCIGEIEKYLNKWDSLENYTLQENALEKLFNRTYPQNTEIEDVLIKVSSLNDFYSTNIFSPFTVAKHIVELNIDKRLEESDVTLVNDIAKVKMDNGNVINFYSFATKYCSHHKPYDYPIYDSYVYKILRYFRDEDSFHKFRTAELKEFPVFKDILITFRNFYGLDNYSLKDIDRYLWQLGKEKFPNKY
jgi:hypothetical protein